jgi:adenosylcobyric acid synthase
VAPFKAQNMSLNSFVTAEGGEIGRAQALQAEACGLPPHVDMNPILLKPETDQRAQVIVHGKVWGKYEGRRYLEQTNDLVRHVRTSYKRLARAYEVIVIEGAGSAAELNLRNRDLANWAMVEFADAAVVLVADIDRGGVFAQVIGTIELLAPQERRRVVGVVINKFRGDVSLFADGVSVLEARTGVPVVGVLPFLRDLELDQEDSVELDRYRQTPFTAQAVNVAVTLVPHLSNFTDFNALAGECDVALRYVAAPSDLFGANVVVLPGTKNTIADLEHLRSRGFVETLVQHVDRGGELVGICGGYQMLGQAVSDPYGVEAGGRTPGMGFLDVVTELLPDKRTTQVEARPLLGGVAPDSTVFGYEIHMGRTRRGSVSPGFLILRRSGEALFKGGPIPEEDEATDGACREDGLVWGTYIHGVFDRPRFRRQWLNRLRQRKGLHPLDSSGSEAVTARLRSSLDRWADHLQKHLQVDRLITAIGVS